MIRSNAEEMVAITVAVCVYGGCVCLCVCVYVMGDEMEISAETNAVGYQKRGKVSRGHIKDV